MYNYIKSFGPSEQKKHYFTFTYDDIEKNKQLDQCPVISAYEYDNFYFLVHRAYAHFFGDINNKSIKSIFKKSNFDIIRECIKSEALESRDKEIMIKKFEELVDKDNFAELFIRTYTKESCFGYILNRKMRNFEKDLISLSYFAGPVLFEMNKYVKDKYFFSFTQNLILHRNIKCSIFDLYLYMMNLDHIICFPSIISTTLKSPRYPTPISHRINNRKNTLVNITMIFNYKHKEGNISPGIIIKDNKASDGKYISSYPNENEVILFPFTFSRITKINKN